MQTCFREFSKCAPRLPGYLTMSRCLSFVALTTLLVSMASLQRVMIIGHRGYDHRVAHIHDVVQADDDEGLKLNMPQFLVIDPLEVAVGFGPDLDFDSALLIDPLARIASPPTALSSRLTLGANTTIDTSCCWTKRAFSATLEPPADERRAARVERRTWVTQSLWDSVSGNRPECSCLCRSSLAAHDSWGRARKHSSDNRKNGSFATPVTILDSLTIPDDKRREGCASFCDVSPRPRSAEDCIEAGPMPSKPGHMSCIGLLVSCPIWPNSDLLPGAPIPNVRGPLHDRSPGRTTKRHGYAAISACAQSRLNHHHRS